MRTSALDRANLLIDGGLEKNRLATKLAMMRLAILACVCHLGCGDADPVKVSTSNGTDSTSNSTSTSATNTAKTGANSSANNAAGNDTANNTASQTATEAEAIISRMAEVYRDAESYGDNAVFRTVGTNAAGESVAYEAALSVAFRAPNQIQARLESSTILCNGEKLYGLHESVPGYAAARDAPAQLTIDNVFFEPLLANINLPAPQFELLLADDMAQRLINSSAVRPVLLEAASLDERMCYRVQFVRRELSQDETTIDIPEIYWIDQENFLLRRIEYPNAGQEVSIEFVAAEMNVNIPDVAFEIDLGDRKVVKRLLPPRHAATLGAKPEPFEFTTLDGEIVSPETLAGKVAVLDFWLADAGGICVANLPRIAQLKEHYADNDQVVFVSVNVDRQTTKEEVQETIKDLSLGQQIALDSGESDAGFAFKFNGIIPYIFVLSPDGEVEYCEMGFGTVAGDDPVPRLKEKIDVIVGGGGLADEMLAAYEAELMSETPVASSSNGQPVVPAAAVAEATEPQSINLEKLWTAEVEQPGNLLVVPGPSGPRIFAHEGYTGLAEISPMGDVIARPDLDLGDSPMATFTRTTTDAEGKRYFAVAAVAHEQVRVFDEDWNLLLAYPEAGTAHPGISDVQFVDLDKSGTPQVAVAYFDVVGVQAVQLNGERTWWNRSLRDVTSLALSTDLSNRPMLLACNSQTGGALVSMLAGGTRGEDLQVGDKYLFKIAGHDLNGDNYNEFCGLTFAEANSTMLVGFAADGTELWTYPLPSGQQRPTLEQIGSGHIAGKSPHWIVAGVDGTIHCVAAGGRVLDSFATGKEISGFAAAEMNDERVLLLSTPEGVEAWRVSDKQ